MNSRNKIKWIRKKTERLFGGRHLPLYIENRDLSAILAFALLFYLGCADGVSPSSVLAPCNDRATCERENVNIISSNGTSGNSTQCCQLSSIPDGSGGTQQCYMPSGNCTGTDQHDDGAGRSLITAAEMGGTGDAAIIGSTEMEGPNPEHSLASVPPSNTGANQQGASADDSLSLGGKKKDSDGMGNLNLNAPLDTQSGKTSETGTPARSNGGMVQTGSTAPEATPSQVTLLALNEATAVKTVESEGLYGSGGSKGMRDSDKSGTSAPYFGGGSDSTSSGGMNFSGDSSQTAAQANSVVDPNLLDPDDYLTRIGIEESLFKRVERKHLEKQRLWLNESRPNKLK
jgi:hypothetical protein